MKLLFKGIEREIERETNIRRESNMALPCSFGMTRLVSSYNLESEFELIHSIFVLYPFIEVDTKFIGVVFQSHPTFRQPQNNYES